MAIRFAGIAAVGILSTNSTASPAPPLSAADAVETARFMATAPESDSLISLSPDRQRYVIRLAKGDLQRNGVRIDVLAGTFDEDGAPSSPIEIAKLFSTGRGVRTNAGPEGDASGRASPLKWLDNRRIAFLCSDENEVRQVVTIDTASKRVAFETQHPTQIRAFDMSPNGTIVFLAAADHSGQRRSDPPSDGYVVPEGVDAVSLAEGYFDGSNIFTRAWDSEWFLQRPGERPKQLKIGFRAIDVGYPNLRFVTLSPDGRRALLLAPAQAIPTEWDHYAKAATPYGAELKAKLHAARRDMRGLAARDVMQLYMLDTIDGTSRPLWTAIGPAGLVRAWWSPDAQRVVLTPTPLPLSPAYSDPSIHNYTAVVDVLSSESWRLAVDETDVLNAEWRGNGGIRVTLRGAGGTSRKRYALASGSWRPRADGEEDGAPHPLRIEVKQSLNSPPRLVALDKFGSSEKTLLDPNPELLSKFQLGMVQHRAGVLSTGERWTALLTRPSRERSGERYPLVIQGQASTIRNDRFTLYGWSDDNGLGPCDIAPYAAQLLAGRNIAALQVSVEAQYGTPSEVETVLRAYQKVAEALVEEGLVNRDRVGITGFSRNGYFTYQALARGAFPFAAAVVVDNYDPSYLQTTLLNMYADAESAIGAAPFGSGLQEWLRRSTGFNVDKINAPLLIIGQSGGVRENILWQWEILGRLRHLERPVEMYLMPELDAHPSHSMQNPKQVIAVQDRVVDWFDFWLNGREVGNAGKRAQYERWRRLRRNNPSTRHVQSE